MVSYYFSPLSVVFDIFCAASDVASLVVLRLLVISDDALLSGVIFFGAFFGGLDGFRESTGCRFEEPKVREWRTQYS